MKGGDVYEVAEKDLRIQRRVNDPTLSPITIKRGSKLTENVLKK